jgi:hypothetical protein
MLSRVGGRGIGREGTGWAKLEIRMSKPSPRDMRSTFATHFSGTVRAELPSPVGGQVAASATKAKANAKRKGLSRDKR